MDNYIISHFNLKHADIYNPQEKMYTYFFKDPIVLNEEYIMKISSFNFLEGEGSSINFITETDVGVIYNTNYGFDLAASEGIWHYAIPNTDLTLVIEIYDPLFATRAARILDVLWGGGFNDPSVIFAATSANDYIEIPNMQVIRVSDGLEGWYKSISSGTLKIRINTIQVQLSTFSYNNINVHVKNLRFSNVKHFNSDKGSLPRIGTFNNNTNNIYSNKLELLTLEPQIINSVTFKIYDEDNSSSFVFSNTTISHILNFSLIMKKKNLIYNYIDE